MEAAKRDVFWVSDGPGANKGIRRLVATFALHSYPLPMLHIVRQHAQSLGIKIILGIIVAVFVLWGVEGVVSGVNSQATVAVIDGAPIEINTLMWNILDSSSLNSCFSDHVCFHANLSL